MVTYNDIVKIKNNILKAKDVRRTINNLTKKGYNVKTKSWENKAAKCLEYWTDIRIEGAATISFNWTIGRDEYDDKLTHVWGISY